MQVPDAIKVLIFWKLEKYEEAEVCFAKFRSQLFFTFSWKEVAYLENDEPFYKA